MARHITAKCRVCNYNIGFSFGGTRANYLFNCPVPSINKNTGEFESVNYLIEKNNQNYIFYSDDVLKGNNLNRNTIRNFDLLINEHDNFCPKCKNFTFDFNGNVFLS